MEALILRRVRGTGTLRQAIIDANADASVPDDIVFDIPASTAANLDVPEGDISWKRRLRSWHPDLDDQAGQSPAGRSPIQVTIDGYSEAHAGVPFRYPSQLSLAVQTLSVLGSPTGGDFTLTELLTFPV